MTGRYAVVTGFLATILVGALALVLPCSGAGGERIPFLDALFTSCSAVCITGLTVIEPGVALSRTGQWILLALVEVGCAGLITFGTFFLICAGRRLSVTSEFSLSDAYGSAGVKGLKGLIVGVILMLLVLQGLGTCALGLYATRNAGTWAARFAAGDVWFESFFTAAMAFCNAGFSLEPGSLAHFRHAIVPLVTLGLLVMSGGFGFIVLYNLVTIRFWSRNRVKRGHLSLHSRVVLRTSFVLVLVVFVAFLLLEHGGALAGLSGPDELAVAFFQAVTPRTCGYTVISVDAMRPVTRFLMEVLMFVGAAPGGAGGGVKVTTLIVFATTLWAICRGRRETVLHGRTVPEDVVREALVIFCFFFGAVVLTMGALLLTESGRAGLSFENLLFEAVSAVSTTGLSQGDTTRLLSGGGRCVLMLAMFFGRLGALSVVFLIGGRESEPSFVRYPKEELIVG